MIGATSCAPDADAPSLLGTSNLIVEREGLPNGRYFGFVVLAGLVNYAYEIEYETDAGCERDSAADRR